MTLTIPQLPGRGCFAKVPRAKSGAAAPEPTVAPGDELQTVFIPRPASVFRQLELLLGRFPALAVLPELLHLGGGLLQQGELVLRVLLGPKAPVRCARMAGNEPLPIQREHLPDEILR